MDKLLATIKLIVLLIVLTLSVAAPAEPTYSTAQTLAAYFRFGQFKVFGFGSHQTTLQLDRLLTDLVFELERDLDYIGTGISVDEQQNVDDYVAGDVPDFHLSEGVERWKKHLLTIRNVNARRFERGQPPIRVLALGMSTKGVSTKKWFEERGVYMHSNLKRMTGFKGRGLLVATPHYLAKGAMIPTPVLARRILRVPSEVPTAGHLIRNEPEVDGKMLHVWVEERVRGHLAEPIYEGLEQYDLVVSMPKPEVGHCAAILTGVIGAVKGPLSRALAFPDISR